ncbi:MAG: glycosyltransferase family 4 protein, partial [Bryobacteraceae bacterium]
VGGNAEVVADAGLGTVVPFGDADGLRAAIEDALQRIWDRAAIRRYAEENSWDRRVSALVDEFRSIMAARARVSGVEVRPDEEVGTG